MAGFEFFGGGGSGAVDSVNGETGDVILTTDDVSEGSTNKYFTASRARAAAVQDAIVDGITDVAPSQNATYDALQERIRFRGDYDGGENYAINDAVIYGGLMYIALTTGAGNQPNTHPANWQPVDTATVPTGTPQTFAGFAPSTGSLESIPGWSFNDENGAVVQHQTDAATSPIGNFHSITEAIEATADSVSGRTTLLLDSHYDRANSGFNLAANFVQIDAYQSHEGSGKVDNLSQWNLSQSLGNGTDASSSNAISQLSLRQSILANATVENVQGYGWFFNSLGSITNNVDGFYMNTNGEMTAVNGRMYTADVNGTFSNQFSGFNLNSNANAQYWTAFEANCQGTISQNVQGYTFNTNSAIGGNLSAFNFNLGSAATVVQDANMVGIYGNNGSSVTGNLRAVNAGIDTNVGASVNLFNGYFNGTAGQQAHGLSISFGNTVTATDLIGGEINLQGTASNQLAGFKVGGQATGASNVEGFEANVSQWVHSGRGIKKTFSGSGGGLQNQFDAHTNVIDFQIADNINSVATVLWIDAGFPINAGQFIFGNNFGSSIIFEDDMGVDAFGGILGYSMGAFVGQIAGASGKTFEKLSFVLAGASVPAPPPGITDGGTISDLSFFKALGLLPAGGNLSINSAYGFKVESSFDGMTATNAWGLHVDTNFYNWIKKSLKIGGSAGSTDRVSNASVVLELEGGVVALPGFTTAEIAALTPSGGWFLYNKDTGGLNYYDGVNTNWVAI